MTTHADRAPLSGLEVLLIGTIVACFIMQILLIFVHEVNWDEFFYLSRIYEFKRGSLDRALQSFHVYLFAWLPWIASDEIAEVRVGRLFMLLCEAGTCLSIYGIARRLILNPAALFSVLVYISFGFVIVHGASFRADPLAAFLLMSSAYILTTIRLQIFECVLLAILGALAFLVTIKSIFFLPIVAGLAIWRLTHEDNPRRLAGNIAITTLASSLIFVALFLLHRASMATDGSDKLVSNAYSKLILTTPFPQAHYIVKAIIGSPLQTGLILAGLTLATANLRTANHRKTAALILTLGSPLLCLIFYRNAFPYFFAFLLPPIAIVAGYAAQRLERSKIAILAIAMMLTATTQFSLALQQRQDVQTRTIKAVHQIFPQPVPYIDRCSMISSFPKIGFFMSTWGIEDYRRAEKPVISSAANQALPVMVIANNGALTDALRGHQRSDTSHALLPKDAKFLHENYVHHWGRIWVAGKILTLEDHEVPIDIAIPGIYTLEATMPVFVDGHRHEPGEVINLTRGSHRVSGAAQTLTLRHGNGLYRPTDTEPNSAIFVGFN